MAGFSYLCILLLASSQMIKAAPMEPLPDGNAKITKFHVNTNIQMRYATTNVETLVKNFANEVSEVFFDMYVPKEAFVSNFSMSLKGQTYVAKVDKKEEAEAKFNESTVTAGLIGEQETPEFKEGKHIKFSAKLDPQEKVTFKLTYEELLHRTNGKYDYQLHIQPQQQVIDDFNIKIHINETLPLKDISTKRLKARGEVKSKAEDITDETLEFDEKNGNVADIGFTPSLEQQENGKDWKLVLNYEVEQPADGNDIQIAGGKFVHYFSPDHLPTIPKHVIFVMDTSGSMSGRKIEQTQDAMTEIIARLDTSKDSLNILSFDTNVKLWDHHSNGEEEVFDYLEFLSDPEATSTAAPTVASNVKREISYKLSQHDILQPKLYFLGLNAGGSTNINDALIEAIETARNVKTAEEIDSKSQQMIIFLTDGEATVGTTNSDAILANVKAANEDMQVPIHCLAFGNGADFNLLTKISDQNHGFAQRIYESGNSFEQIEEFFNGISDPKLKNVEFEYLANGERIPAGNLTTTRIDYALGQNEYVVAGAFDDQDQELNEIKLVIKADGDFQRELTILPCGPPFVTLREERSTIIIDDIRPPCFPHPRPPTIPTTTYKKSDAEAFLERLWAFKRIKYLLEDKDCTKALENTNKTCKEEAIELALEYNFVTEITSMVVEATDGYQGVEAPEDDPFEGGPQLAFAAFAAFAPQAAPPRFGGAHNRIIGGAPGSGGGGIQKFAARLPTSVPRNRNRIRPNSRPSPALGPGLRGGTTPSFRPLSFRPAFTTTTPSFTTSTTFTTTTTTTTTAFIPCKLILYTSTRLRGGSVEFRHEVEDLQDVDFDDKLASLEVQGNCCWTIWNSANFTGDNMTVRPGRSYESGKAVIDVFNQASSAKMTQC